MKAAGKPSAWNSLKKAQLSPGYTFGWSSACFPLELKVEVVRHKKAENLGFVEGGRKFDALPKLIEQWERQYGCRAQEITGLEWNRVDLVHGTAWLDHTKNGTPRGVPLNRDTGRVMETEICKHPMFCFTYKGEPIG